MFRERGWYAINKYIFLVLYDKYAEMMQILTAVLTSCQLLYYIKKRFH